jgi:competence protein ComEA
MQKFLSFLKQYLYIILGITCILAVGVIYMTSRPSTISINPIDNFTTQPSEQSPSEPNSSGSSGSSDFSGVENQPTLLVVHVVGAVYKPGVFELPEGARINDAVRLAGGYTHEADLTRINLAAFVYDAMQIIMPVIGEELIPPPAPATSGGTASGLVNINTANATELQTLPGIGTTIAGNIINFRETHGRFSCVEELIHVNRIGIATLNNIRPLVTV